MGGAGTRFRMEVPMTRRLKHQLFAFAAGAAVAAASSAAYAHHSFAMFDADSKMTLDGVVKDFQWTNPHAWIMLTVANTEGRAEPWAIELGGPSGLARQGWRPKMLEPGMPVSVTIHPLRDGTNGGQFMELTMPDGTVLGRAAAPAAQQN